MIRIDSVRLAVAALDMRAVTEAALARVVGVFGAARPHHAYLFATRRAKRMKVHVYDGIGEWLAQAGLKCSRLPNSSMRSASRLNRRGISDTCAGVTAKVCNGLEVWS